ncbi:hypothetical protein F441_17393 [Phytophthora nicotianae CJ01A1]|uniref:Uncharacterized protein n=5 Tax=Phytophthora nicotianae TaxID=4792 RepID=W2QZC3_PHYN3|nr:hypothetical protein PPTG_21543 [Phytophthora nicotianae INRA-310]ETI36334.1 hypothetical protein F443_17525 [Phytophthora nicotianae P1569]ETO65055.1 hypothetical protein F444_17565 [Phytophthora nicotianae P1976]ETP06174.1 hypothetical protein F441_17393 [Phytophthora nicotianae CJ01A1]ETP34275.1 hypothetical protein F442_17379 [Phytophthora nicotianae P10297]ETN18316.1 hypothetical protein PPTG_21543 [Phytophthora nicotianae INRA-310]
MLLRWPICGDLAPNSKPEEEFRRCIAWRLCKGKRKQQQQRSLPGGASRWKNRKLLLSAGCATYFGP